MKLWKKRWFVLSDLCLFYYRGENTHTQTHTPFCRICSITKLKLVFSLAVLVGALTLTRGLEELL